jgi:hypothetical protein
MFILDVEAARITNVTVVKLLDGGGSIVAWGRCKGHCRWVWTIWRSDYSTGDKNCTCLLSPISEWIGTTSTTTGMTPSASPITAPTAALTETPTVKWDRNVQRLDGGCINRCWYLILLICRRCMGQVVHNRWICNMRGWSTVLQWQVLHVQPHCRLIGRKFVDCCGRRSALVWRQRRIGHGQRGSIRITQCAACCDLGRSLLGNRGDGSSSSVTKAPSSNTLFMLWLCWLATLPCCPLVRNWTATSRRVYAPWTKRLRELNVLLGVAPQSSNSLIRNIPDAINDWTVLVMNCSGVYGLSAITCISWHCLMR